MEQSTVMRFHEHMSELYSWGRALHLDVPNLGFAFGIGS